VLFVLLDGAVLWGGAAGGIEARGRGAMAGAVAGGTIEAGGCGERAGAGELAA